MLNKIKSKLKSRKGASIILALFLMLVCGFSAAAVLTAASSNIGRYAYLREYNQQYLAISSAAQMLRDQFEYMNGRVCVVSYIDNSSYSIDNFDTDTMYNSICYKSDPSMDWTSAMEIGTAAHLDDWHVSGSIITCLWSNLKWVYASSIYSCEHYKGGGSRPTMQIAELKISGDWCGDDEKYSVAAKLDFSEKSIKVRLNCGDYVVEFTVNITPTVEATSDGKYRTVLKYECGTITLPERTK